MDSLLSHYIAVHCSDAGTAACTAPTEAEDMRITPLQKKEVEWGGEFEGKKSHKHLLLLLGWGNWSRTSLSEPVVSRWVDVSIGSESITGR